MSGVGIIARSFSIYSASSFWKTNMCIGVKRPCSLGSLLTLA